MYRLPQEGFPADLARALQPQADGKPEGSGEDAPPHRRYPSTSPLQPPRPALMGKAGSGGDTTPRAASQHPSPVRSWLPLGVGMHRPPRPPGKPPARAKDIPEANG